MKWVTREHPKIDRIACPWLIKRFIDQDPEFLYVPPDQVLSVAKATDATPYDVSGVELSHVGELCSFDAFLKKYGLTDPALQHLAEIVRGADTSRHDLTPQCGGLFAISLGLSAKLVMRFGIRLPLAVGLVLAAAGLLLFVRAPVGGSFIVDVLPSMILLGFGAGMAFNPMLLAAMSDVGPSGSGLASGIVNTAFLMGGALGLAVLASLAASRTDSLTESGEGSLSALTGGYHVAFLVGAIFALAAGGIGAAFLLVETPAEAHAHGPEEAIDAPPAEAWSQSNS